MLWLNHLFSFNPDYVDEPETMGNFQNQKNYNLNHYIHIGCVYTVGIHTFVGY